MVKGKTSKKEKKVSKQKVSLPTKVKKGQITKKELKSVGFISPDNELKSSAPVESISGIGIKKGAMLRAGGIDDVGEYKRSFKDFFIAKKARKPKPKPKKPKPKPIKPKPKPKPKPKKVEVVSEVPFLDKRVLDIKETVEMNDYEKSRKYVRGKSDFNATINRLDNLKTELGSIERDMGILRDTPTNRKALARLHEVQALNDVTIKEWKAKREEFLEKKKVPPAVKGKGNDYIADKMLPKFFNRPKPKEWKREELRQELINVYEAEYGKTSKVTKQMKEISKTAHKKEIWEITQDLRNNYPYDFPTEKEILAD
jgi:hypothetical protein